MSRVQFWAPAQRRNVSEWGPEVDLLKSKEGPLGGSGFGSSILLDLLDVKPADANFGAAPNNKRQHIILNCLSFVLANTILHLAFVWRLKL